MKQKLNQYKIEHRISTLVDCALFEIKNNTASFQIGNIKYSQIDFNIRDGWNNKYWLADSIIQESCLQNALTKFRKQLFSTIPKISFISQAYIDFRFESFLVHKSDHQFAFIKYTSDIKPVSLMFRDEEKKALSELNANTEIHNEFFLYWNDAVNATGYSAKLLLMFSAIEALTKKKNGRTDHGLREEILGKDLKIELFGEKNDSENALRNRLVHGEYFQKEDSARNYVETIHNRVINYFNNKILSKPLISEDVKNPQRHFWGNYKMWRGFIERYDKGNYYDLEEILTNFENNGVDMPIVYRIVPEEKVNEELY